MGELKEICINSHVPSSCAVMDWLKQHNYPDCNHTHIKLSNGGYGGIISSFNPDPIELEHWKRVLHLSYEYHEMYRSRELDWAWRLYMPEVNKCYFLTI